MIRPTFYAFETAKRALQTSQRGLDTVGHNISNVNTLGYTRQRVDQVSFNVSNNKAKYVVYQTNNQQAGHGSVVTGISQIRDLTLDKRYRQEMAEAGQYGATSEGLANINSIFDEITTDGGLAYILNEILTQIDVLNADPSSAEQAAVLQGMFSKLTQTLQQNANSLNNAMITQQEEMQFCVDSVNSLLEQISILNVKIKEANIFGDPANELNDTRNLLIDQLSEFLDIEVKRTPVELGSGIVVEELSIYIKDSGNTTLGREPVELVKGGNYNGLKLEFADDGKVTVLHVDGISGTPIVNSYTKTSDITNIIYTGALKGNIDLLNGTGVLAADGYDFNGFPYYKMVLDDFAQKLAESVNNNNRIEIFDGLGNSMGYLNMDLLTSKDGEPISASNICVTELWKNDPFALNLQQRTILALHIGGNQYQLLAYDENGDHYFFDTPVPIDPITGNLDLFVDSDGNMVDQSGNKYQFTNSNGDQFDATIHNVQRVDSNGNAVNPSVPYKGDNDNLLKLKSLFESSHTFKNGKTVTFREYLVNMQSTMAQDKETIDTKLKASVTNLTSIAGDRDSISAVSIDEEGINMMMFQNYYNAAARYMTVLDEALGTIIQGMGIVGR